MRSIKFRAWDKEESKFINIKSFGFLEDGEVWYVQAIDESERELDPPYFTGEDDLVIIQNTGLHDKNGKEIYEQDILEVESFEGSKSVVRVVFEDGCFCHIGHLGDLRTYPLRDFLFNGSKVQVIGNIFQHPHLLEESP